MKDCWTQTDNDKFEHLIYLKDLSYIDSYETKAVSINFRQTRDEVCPYKLNVEYLKQMYIVVTLPMMIEL